MSRRQSISGGIRITAVGFKFVFVLMAARFIPENEYVEIISLISAAMFGVFLVGLDLWTYVYRRIVNFEGSDINVEINRDLSAIFLSFVIFSFISIVLGGFLGGNLRLNYVIPIVFVEGLCFQFARYFQAKQDVIWFSGVMAAKTGLWPLVCLLMMLFSYRLSIAELVMIWVSFGVIIALASWIALSLKYSIKFNLVLDANWLKSALGFSLAYWVSTILIKVMVTVDKIVIASAENINSAYVYALSASAAGIYMLFLDSFVYSHYSPRLVKEFKWDRLAFLSTSKRFLKVSFQLSLLIFLSMIPVFYLLIEFTGKQFMHGFAPLFFLVQFGMYIFAISFAFHHINYGAERHRYNQLAQVVGGSWFLLGIVIFDTEPLNVVVIFISSAVIVFLIKLAGVRNAFSS